MIKKIKAPFALCEGNDRSRAQGCVDVLAKARQAKPSVNKVFRGRLALKLLNAEAYKVQGDVAK